MGFKNKRTGDFHVNVPKYNEFCRWNSKQYLKRPVKGNVSLRRDDGTKCRPDEQNANEFAKHLERTFQPYDFNSPDYKIYIDCFLKASLQMDIPIAVSQDHKFHQRIDCFLKAPLQMDIPIAMSSEELQKNPNTFQLLFWISSKRSTGYCTTAFF